MATVFSTGRGTAELDVRGPRVIRVVYTGSLDIALAGLIEPALEMAIKKSSGASIFADLEFVTAYTSERRAATTRFWKRNMRRICGAHVLVDPRARLLAMAAEVIKLSLDEGARFIYRDRASFDREMDRIGAGLAATG